MNRDVQQRTRSFIVVGLLWAACLPAAIIISDVAPYTQDFNALPSEGTQLLWDNNVTIPGWYRNYSGTQAEPLRDHSLQAEDENASGVVGEVGFINTGVNGNSDRSLTLRLSSQCPEAAIGAVFQNAMGHAVTGFHIRFTGEQWRRSMDTASLYFEYAVVSSLDTQTLNVLTDDLGWIRVDALEHEAVTGGVSGVNGSRSLFQNGYGPLMIPATIENGHYLAIRWLMNQPGNVALGIDDVSVVLDTGLPPHLYAADYGATANNGECDAHAIRAAIEAASLRQDSIVVFDAGVYNLKEESAIEQDGALALIHVHNHRNMTLRGAVTPEGDPATVFEMNLELGNDVRGATHIDFRNGSNLVVENLILDHDPRFASAGEIVAVDRSTGTVEIEIFPGMPHFEGMKSYSANNWDLQTRLLIQGPALTIGTHTNFPTWENMQGQERRYRMVNAEFVDGVEVGQGISFHFNISTPDARVIDAYRLEDILFRNIHIYSALGMPVGAGDCRNMTFEGVHIKPEGNSLAVGPRDGIHITRSTGTLWVDDLYVKGVRWDPFVSYLRMLPVEERDGGRRIRISSTHAQLMRRLRGVLEEGSELIFWSGEIPHEAVIQSMAVEEGSQWWIVFTEDLPSSVVAGSLYSPKGWWWENAVIQNSVIEGNFGTALVYQSGNLRVENCVFRNNSYSNIGLGPTSSNAGSFTGNILIRNNFFEESTWVEKYEEETGPEHRGTITLFQRYGGFSNEAYHQHITIEGNVFRGINADSRFAAIHIKNARGVIVRSNLYEQVANTVMVDSGSTADIVNAGIGRNRVTHSAHAIESLPEYLWGLKLITVTRGPNEPVEGYSFNTGSDVTVYLAVHQRGEPQIPGAWERMPEEIQWVTSTGITHKDWIYRRRFTDGQVEIPAHPGFSGAFYALPHMVFIRANEGASEDIVISGFPSDQNALVAPAPGFNAVWSVDERSPLLWAREVGFRNGTALNVYQGYLLNKKDLDQPFEILQMGVQSGERPYAIWESDGMAHGQVRVRGTDDLSRSASEWEMLPGTTGYQSGHTTWTAEEPSGNERLFFDVIITPAIN